MTTEHEPRSRAAVVGQGISLHKDPHIHLRIPAKAEYVALCRLAITALAYGGGLDEEGVADLKLAVTEACTNLIAHAGSVGGYSAEAAGEEGSAPEISVEYELLSDRWVVTVSTDRSGGGGGEDAVTSDDGELGFVVMRALADEAEIMGREGGGASIRLIKYLE